MARQLSRMTRALRASYTDQSDFEIAVEVLAKSKNPEELIEILRSDYRLTRKDRDLLIQFFEGRLKRGRGRPGKNDGLSLGIIDRGSKIQRAAAGVSVELQRMKSRKESVYGKRRKLVERQAEIYKVPEEAVWSAIKRGHKRARKIP